MSPTDFVTCHRCNGARIVEYVNGRVIPCPHCNGAGRVRTELLDAADIVEEGLRLRIDELERENARLLKLLGKAGA